MIKYLAVLKRDEWNGVLIVLLSRWTVEWCCVYVHMKYFWRVWNVVLLVNIWLIFHTHTHTRVKVYFGIGLYIVIGKLCSNIYFCVIRYGFVFFTRSLENTFIIIILGNLSKMLKANPLTSKRTKSSYLHRLYFWTVHHQIHQSYL